MIDLYDDPNLYKKVVFYYAFVGAYDCEIVEVAVERDDDVVTVEVRTKHGFFLEAVPRIDIQEAWDLCHGDSCPIGVV